MTYRFAIEKHDIGRIDKLNKLTDIKTFWDDVRKLTKNVFGSHADGRWQCLAECRYLELKGGKELLSGRWTIKKA